MRFHADVDRLICESSENNADDENLCEIESSANWSAKKVHETPMDRSFERGSDFLRDQKLLAVIFHEACGFCAMKQTTCSN